MLAGKQLSAVRQRRLGAGASDCERSSADTGWDHIEEGRSFGKQADERTDEGVTGSGCIDHLDGFGGKRMGSVFAPAYCTVLA